MRHVYLRRMIVGIGMAWLILGWVSVALSAQITLAWDANTEPDLGGYRVYYGTTSNSYGTPVTLGKVTTYTIPGLNAGQTYYMSVTAFDTATNESVHSNEVSGVARDATASITVTSNPAGRQFVVDGTSYSTSQTFTWVVGASHRLSVTSPQAGSTGTQYAFTSWSDGGAQTHDITVPSATTTYTATFAIQYSLTTAAASGGSVSPAGTSWYNSGQSASFTATPNAGYSFLNWSGDLTGSANPGSLTMNAPRSVTANFSQNQYTLNVTANPGAGGSVTKNPNKASYVYNEQVTLTATAGSGYAFDNWNGDLSGTTNPGTLTLNGNKAVTANFTATPETVSVPTVPSGQASGNTGISYAYTTGGSTSNLGHTVEYQFDWKGDGTDLSTWGAASQSKTWNAAGAYNVRARARCTTHTSVVSNWSNGRSVTIAQSPVSCTVATSPSGLAVTVDGTSYPSPPQAFSWVPGSTHTIGTSSPQNESSGTRQSFATWSDGGTQSHTITVPSSNVTYTANFTTQYSLAMNAGSGGTVSPSGTNWYNNGQSVTLTATPNAGYGFSSWSGDLSGSSNPISLTMNGPKSVTANFTQGQYTLTLTIYPPTSGSVTKSPDKVTYIYGEQVTLTATPGPDYNFFNWSGDLTGAANPMVVTMDRDKAVTANFTSLSGGALSINPSNGFSSGGKKGGPFYPTSYTYTLKNSGATAIGWAASNRQNWVNLSGTSGTLAPGGSADVIVSINGNANGLEAGTYDETVAFTNTTNHSGDTALPVKLTAYDGGYATHKIATSPSGLDIWVDGTVYKSPKKFKWEIGTLHTISAIESQETPNGKRYHFISWSDSELLTHTLMAPPVGTTYTANFKTEYSLTTSVNKEGVGTVSPSGVQWFAKGETVSLSAAPEVGYHLKNWINQAGDVVIGKGNPISITMKGPKKIRANFINNSYPLVVDREPSSGGTVSKKPNKTMYFHGEQVTLTAKPKHFYSFSGWGGDATGTETTITITMDGQKTITANFSLDPDVPQAEPQVAKDEGRLPLIGQIESPGDGKTLSGVKPIYGWALDGEAVKKVELFIDGHSVCQIPYGGLREDLKERHPMYPEAEQGGFALIWNFSLLSAGDHTIGIKVHNSRGDVLDLSAKISVIKFHGDLVTDLTPDTPYTCPVTVTADGVTRTYDVNVQWLSEIQDFGITEIVPTK
jgi:uncharacterized repeat protein (TIGR02543 family)